MAATPLFVGLVALGYMPLSARVLLGAGVTAARRIAGLGAGGDRRLLRRMRVHGNFTGEPEAARSRVIGMALSVTALGAVTLLARRVMDFALA